MKNNVILKGIFLIVALCSSDFMSGRPMGEVQGTTRTTTTPGATRTSGTTGPRTTPTVSRTGAQVKLSAGAEDIVEESKAGELSVDQLKEKLRKGIERRRFTPNDIKAIETEIERLRKLAKRSGRTKEEIKMEKFMQGQNMQVAALQNVIVDLQRQLATQNKGFLANMYDYMTTAGQYLGAGGLGASAVWYLVATASTGGMVAGAAAAATLMGGFKYLASKSQTGELSDFMKSLLGENLIAQAIRDSRYLTYESKLEGIDQDMRNTGLINEDTFKGHCKKVYANIVEERDKVYAANAAIKDNEAKINKEIQIIRTKYRDAYNQGPQAYMEKLEKVEKIANIIEAQALVSEYLRACFRIEQQKAYEQAKKEQAEKAAAQPKKESWLSGWRLGGG